MSEVDSRHGDQERNEAKNKRSGKRTGIKQSGKAVTCEHEKAPSIRGSASFVCLLAALIDSHSALPLPALFGGRYLQANAGGNSSGGSAHGVERRFGIARESKLSRVK